MRWSCRWEEEARRERIGGRGRRREAGAKAEGVCIVGGDNNDGRRSPSIYTIHYTYRTLPVYTIV